MTQWSLADVMNAIDIIEAYEDAKAEASEREASNGR